MICSIFELRECGSGAVLLGVFSYAETANTRPSSLLRDLTRRMRIPIQSEFLFYAGRPTSVLRPRATVGFRDSLLPKKNGPVKKTLPGRSQERLEQPPKSPGSGLSSRSQHGTYVRVHLHPREILELIRRLLF